MRPSLSRILDALITAGDAAAAARTAGSVPIERGVWALADIDAALDAFDQQLQALGETLTGQALSDYQLLRSFSESLYRTHFTGSENEGIRVPAGMLERSARQAMLRLRDASRIIEGRHTTGTMP